MYTDVFKLLNTASQEIFVTANFRENWHFQLICIHLIKRHLMTVNANGSQSVKIKYSRMLLLSQI